MSTITSEVRTSTSSRKALEGVQATDALRQLIRDVRSLGTSQVAATDDELLSSQSVIYNVMPSVSPQDAVETLRQFDTAKEIVPILVLRAVETLCAKNQECSKRLDDCLRKTKLAFTPPPPTVPETEERIKFRRRMERLKLQSEESRYAGLTKNVGLRAPSDDITTRSMTYAASIGLNMIIAPLSFGCFMYFFAGGLFNYFGWDNNRPAHHGPDIRKVIAGVVSGVIMLFIEMVLFVIRSHEMDKATRKKAKTSKAGAFGPYTARTQRHFKGQ